MFSLWSVNTGLAGVDDGKPASSEAVGSFCLVGSGTDDVLVSRDCHDVVMGMKG